MNSVSLFVLPCGCVSDERVTEGKLAYEYRLCVEHGGKPPEPERKQLLKLVRAAQSEEQER